MVTAIFLCMVRTIKFHLVNFELKEVTQMSFYSEMEKILKKNKTLTENGGVGYETSGHALVDMNYKVASYRTANEGTILADFLKAFSETPELAIKWMFYAGDVREGLGERRLFKILVKNVLPKYPRLIKFIPEYSRWDVVTELLGTSVETEAVELIREQLKTDLDAMKDGKSISLLAKWMPSVNTSSKRTVAKANKLCSLLGMKPAEYRKTLSKLRAYSNVVEVKLCKNEWSDVNYEAVPSKANLKYKDAFLKHDESRRREFLGKLTKGEAKINASAAFPHEVVYKYRYQSGRYSPTVDPALEGMWKNLKSIEMTKPMIVVRDGSGSMECCVGGTLVQALDVATALAIYCSEHAAPGFENEFITFGNNPKLVKFGQNMTLRDKMTLAYHEADCSNTDIEATMDLILNVAKSNNMRQDQIPDVLIISDMEFDSATTCCIYRYSWQRTSTKDLPTVFESIRQKYKAEGYDLPGMVFWNVNSRTNAIPLQDNKYGVKLLSGFSQNVLNMALSNKLDPFEVLKETLLSKRYEVIK